MKKLFRTSYFILLTSYLFTACTTIDLYEKSITIPKHQWESSFKPSFDFIIKDTTSPYKLFFILRHNEKYSFNNIYINIYVKGPGHGQDSALKIQQDLVLATNEKGWLATGMDDIYEHRIPLAPEQSLKAGTYTFTIEQIMREDPLKNVLNAGLRIEKK
ncbi:MAG: gliding motility lipoprotein GldH [Chitinophagaceae bacterium]